MSNLRKIRKAIQSPGPASATGQGQGRVERIDLDRSELEAILAHAKTALSEEEYAKLHAAMETLIFLTAELEKNRVSVQRLKQLLFGATTEKTRKVMEKILDDAGKAKQSGGSVATGDQPASPPEKAPGHGRNGAQAYGRVHLGGRIDQRGPSDCLVLHGPPACGGESRSPAQAASSRTGSTHPDV